MKFCWVRCPWWGSQPLFRRRRLVGAHNNHLSKWINCLVARLSPHWGEQRDWSDLVFLLALMGGITLLFIYWFYCDANINLWWKSCRSQLQSQWGPKSKENQRALCWDYRHNEQSQRLRGYSWTEETRFSSNYRSTNCSDASSKSSDLERLVSFLPWWGDMQRWRNAVRA